MTFFSSTELPTTHPAPTRAEPRMKAQWRTSVSGPMMQGAPRKAVGATEAVLWTQTWGDRSSYSAGSSRGPRSRMKSLMPSRASQGY